VNRRYAHQTIFDVYRIPYDGPEASLPTKEMVGSKAHNLMRMARRGLSVPPGFVLGTSLCRAYLDRGIEALDGLEEVLERELEALGARTGRRFGDTKRPLLVSARSGAPVSMPGMMETVLNIGLTNTTLRGLLRLTGNPRLTADCRRRFVQQFAEVIHGLEAKPFEEILAARLKDEKLAQGEELDSRALNELAAAFEEKFQTLVGHEFPCPPTAQLRASVEAILKSWMSKRAQTYRKLNNISDLVGTATTVQQMVFGNAGPGSGSGVGFTRNPSDGTNALFVDYLTNAQGEDVVAGRRNVLGMEELERRAPESYQQMMRARGLLEQEFGDMQDFEFTVEEGHLYMLQARSGKRTPLAALRIAHDLLEEKIIPPQAALALLDGLDLDAVEAVELAPQPGMKPIARCVPASAGVAVGLAVFDTSRVAEFKCQGKPVVLLREHTETADIEALSRTEALVTAHGARTSHAAVVARQLGKVCLVGCHCLKIDAGGRSCSFGATAIQEGEAMTVDGTSGLVYRGELPVTRAKPKKLIDSILQWQHSGTRPKQARKAS
jgi:pyruvate,orthophosphate dikinase